MAKDELKSKIKDLFPEIEKYGLEFDLEMDKETDAWLARFKKGEHELATHLEEQDWRNAWLEKNVIIWAFSLVNLSVITARMAKIVDWACENSSLQGPGIMFHPKRKIFRMEIVLRR